MAGTVAAIALLRAGWDVTVCEARSVGAEGVGAFLTLQVNGIDGLRAVDMDVTGLGFRTPSMRLRNRDGRVLGEVGTGEPLPDGTVGVTLRRSDLYAALRNEAVRRGAAVEFGRRLVDAGPASGGVRAEFEDGSIVDADVLIGADGLHSRVRQVIDPDADPPRYVPVLDTGGFAPAQPTDGRGGSFEMIFGRRAFFGYGVAPDGEVWWFANPPRRDEPGPGELAAVTSDGWREQLLELFAADRSPACAIIASSPGEIRGWATYDLPRVRRWHRDRMIVVGDAAHAMSPAAGQGASMAIEDAVQLARCLRDHPEPAAAFGVYEALRRDRVERVVAHGARTTSSKVAGPIGRVVRDLVFPVVLRFGDVSPRWMHHHHIDWAARTTDGPPVHR